MTTGISVKDSMVTEVITASPEQTVQEGADMMRRKDVGSLVICEGNKPVGMVTREDIVNKVTSRNKNASEVKLRDIMNSPVVSTTSSEDLGDAAKKMSKYGYERLPVIDDGKLVGIISDREVAKICPAAIEILRERLLIETPNKFDEITDGECELCGNYSDELRNINDRWVCESCREEAEGL